MGFLGSILAEGAAGSIKGILEGAGSFAKDIRSVLTGEISTEDKATLLQKAADLEGAVQTGQIAINVEEAKHPSIFVSGWRPFIGWVCGFGLATYFLPKHVMAAILWTRVAWSAMDLYVQKMNAIYAAGGVVDPQGILAVLPAYPIDAQGLIELVLGMLGLIGVRTFEKLAGTARN